jgi:hypothetical protein
VKSVDCVPPPGGGGGGGVVVLVDGVELKKPLILDETDVNTEFTLVITLISFLYQN